MLDTTIRGAHLLVLAASSFFAALLTLASPARAPAESDDRVTVDGVIQDVAADGKSFKLKYGAKMTTIQVNDETLVKGELKKGAAVTVVAEKSTRLAIVVVPAKKKPAPAETAKTDPPKTDPPKTTAPKTQSKPAASTPARQAAPIDPLAAEKAWSAAKGKLMEVVVTGVGKSLDDAKQNAYQAAVEQTFGVLVDAGALVAGDKLVDEFALTYADGDVHDWKELDKSEKGGLHSVRMRVNVSVEKLAARLKAQNIAMRDVPGEMFYKIAPDSIATDADALAALKELVKRFGPDKLIRPLIVDRPEVIDQNENFATLQVKVQTVADGPGWNGFRKDLLALIGTDRATKQSQLVFDSTDDLYPDSDFYTLHGNDETVAKMYKMQKDGAEYAYWLMVAKDWAPTSQPGKAVSRWDAFWVGKASGPILESLAEREYMCRVAIMDADNTVLAETDRKLSMWSNPVKPMYFVRNGGYSRDDFWLAPYFWGDGHYYSPRWKHEPFLVDVALVDLKNATRVVATIEEAPVGKKE